MIRPVLALLVRSQTEDSRRVLTYLGRTALLGVVLVMLLLFQVNASLSGSPGLDLFGLIVITDVIFLSLGAVTHLAASIAEEKEEMMIGMLRMTNLGPMSILLGKGVSRSIELWYLVLLQVPLALLAITLGGVSVGQIVAAFLTLVTYLIFLTGLTLFISVLSPRTSVAVTALVILLLAFHFMPVLIDELDIFGFGYSDLPWRFSPFYQLGRIAQTGFPNVSEPGFIGAVLNVQTISNAALGLMFFFFAWCLFDRFTRQVKEPTPPRLFFAHKNHKSRIKPGPVWGWAIAWKDYHFMAGGKPVLLMKFVAYALLLWPVSPLMLGESINPLKFMNNREFMDLVPATLSAILIVELLYCASQVFGEEIRSGTFPALMTLPIPMDVVVLQKVAGICAGLVPALLLWTPLALRYLATSDADGRRFVIYAFVHVIFLAHVVALFSLYLKRGAVILAIAILAGGWTLGIFIVDELLGGVIGWDAQKFLLNPYVHMVIMGVLLIPIHWRIHRRIRVVAVK